MSNNLLQGAPLAVPFHRRISEPLDASCLFADYDAAARYAMNIVPGENFCPYEGQIVSVVADGTTPLDAQGTVGRKGLYKLVPTDPPKGYDRTLDYDETGTLVRGHYQLEAILSASEGVLRDGDNTFTGVNAFTQVLWLLSGFLFGQRTADGKGYEAAGVPRGMTIDAGGRVTLTTDDLYVLGVTHLNEIDVDHIRHTGGMLVVTAAQLIVDHTEHHTDGSDTLYFRRMSAEGQAVRNMFRTGDLALMMTFNERLDGSINRFYWREVTDRDNYDDAVGMDDDEQQPEYGFITLAAGGTSNATPRAGDVVVQLGNTTDSSRQGATVLGGRGMYGGYLAVYGGFSSPTQGSPKLDDYDSALVYLSARRNKVTGEFISTTGVNLADRIGQLNSSLNAVRRQTDRQLTVWYADETPLPTASDRRSNAPASEWIEADTTGDGTPSEQALHEYDLCYVRGTLPAGAGRAWQWGWNEGAGRYLWHEISDADTLRALEAAAGAQATADEKRRVFATLPGELPQPPYDVNDVWVYAEGTFTCADGETQRTYGGDILRCVTARALGDTPDVDDWGNATSATSATIRNLGDRITMAVSDMDYRFSRMTQTVEGFTAAVEEAGDGYSQLSQTVEGFEARVQTVEGNNTTLSQTVSGLVARVQTVEGNYTTLSQTVSGFEARVETVEGNYTTLSQTVEGFEARVQTVEGNYTTLSQTVSGFEARVETVEGYYSEIEANAAAISMKVGRNELTQAGIDIEEDRVVLTAPKVYIQTPAQEAGGEPSTATLFQGGYIRAQYIDAETIRAGLATVDQLNALEANIPTINAQDIVTEALSVTGGFNANSATINNLNLENVTAAGVIRASAMYTSVLSGEDIPADSNGIHHLCSGAGSWANTFILLNGEFCLPQSNLYPGLTVRIVRAIPDTRSYSLVVIRCGSEDCISYGSTLGCRSLRIEGNVTFIAAPLLATAMGMLGMW